MKNMNKEHWQMATKTIINLENIKNIVKNSNIKHIAIIMDGNRRWAKKRMMPSIAGHNEGVSALKRTVQAAVDFGLKNLTVYAFSTENWGRKQEEVDFLMFLIKETIQNESKELNEKGVRIKIIGDVSRLGENLRKILSDAEELTKDNTTLNLQIAINYGARNEIVAAVQNIAEKVKNGELNPQDISEETIAQSLYTDGIPDPDLLIRTGGEQRISNYLLWQIAYTELYITDAFWPEFDEEHLALSIEEFADRERRFGRD